MKRGSRVFGCTGAKKSRVIAETGNLEYLSFGAFLPSPIIDSPFPFRSDFIRWCLSLKLLRSSIRFDSLSF